MSDKTPTLASRRTIVITAVVTLFALILCIVLAINLFNNTSSSNTSTTTATSGTTCNAITIAKTVLPSVVTIHVRSEKDEGGSGSGEFIDRKGHVLTNDHVIAAGATSGKIAVVLSDGTALDAKLVGRATRLDLAVLKVTGDHPAIAIGDSSKVLLDNRSSRLVLHLGCLARSQAVS